MPQETCNSCAFQPQFRSSFWPGQKLIETISLSHVGLLQKGLTGYMALTYGCGWLGRCTLGLIFTLGFIFSELPKEPGNMPHLRTRWARYAFHWYDYPTTIFVPSLGPIDVMLQDDALTNFQPLMLNKYKSERWFYKTNWP